MSRSLRMVLVCLVSALTLAALTSPAAAQRRGMSRLFGVITTVQLAQLEEVQTELKLTDEQKTKVATLNDDLAEERRAAREGAGGDFEKMRKEITLLNAEFTKEFNELLDDAQKKRAQEIYLQVNGPLAVTDEAVAAELKLTDDQKTKLEQSLTDSRTKMFSEFQGLQSLSEEERAAKINELIQSRDEGLLAVLDEAQKKQLEEMKGAKLEVDLSKLPGPGR